MLHLLSLLIVGPEGMMGCSRAVVRPGTADKVGFQAIGSHTFSGLVHGIAEETQSRAVYLIMAAATMALFCWWIFRPQTATSNNLRAAAALAILTALLISSHSLQYDLALRSVPLAIYGHGYPVDGALGRLPKGSSLRGSPAFSERWVPGSCGRQSLSVSPVLVCSGVLHFGDRPISLALALLLDSTRGTNKRSSG